MRQGDVCMYPFQPPNKTRPVVVLTRSKVIPHLSAVVVAQITRTIRAQRSFVPVDERDGLKEPCAVNLDGIDLAEQNKFGKYVTHLSPETMRQIRDAIVFALALEIMGSSSSDDDAADFDA